MRGGGSVWPKGRLAELQVLCPDVSCLGVLEMGLWDELDAPYDPICIVRGGDELLKLCPCRRGEEP